MPTAPRPTLRCLADDLRDDWRDVRDQRAVINLDECPPLHSLNHPAIKHAVDTFSDTSNGLKRESISAVRDVPFWKLKTTTWRGAVYIDSDGQAWLVAAGLRRDFYRVLAADIQRHGVEKYLPRPEDAARLKCELADERLAEWEQRVHDDAVGALEVADHAGTATFMINDPLADSEMAGAEVEIERVIISREDDSLADGEGDSLVEVVITVTPMDWSKPDPLKRAEMIIMAAIHPDEQSWTPGHTGSQHIYSICVGGDDADALIIASRGEDRVPGRMLPGTVRHYTAKACLTDHQVEGTSARALCGTYFVPRQLPDNLETCPRCDSIYRSLPGQET